MNEKQIVKMILIILLFSLLIIFGLIVRNTYINKIKPINEKKVYLEKLKQNNKDIINKIKEENRKSKNIDNILKENKAKREQLEKKVYEKESSISGKIIYLTFDDGPSIYTNEILNILDKYKIKATFFVVCSNNLEEYTKKYIEKGHTIGLHSCTHKYSNIYSSEESYFNDLNYLSSLVENYTGYKSKYIRFPGGSSNTVSRFNRGIMTKLSNKLKENGYKYFDWNIDSNDAAGANSNQIYSNVIGALENNNRNISMVLMHDTKSSTKDALDSIIKDALQMGYTFANINDYTPEVHHGINN